MKTLILILASIIPIFALGQTKGSVTRVGVAVVVRGDSAIRLAPGNRVYLDQLCDVSTALSSTPAWTLENYCSTGLPMVFLRHDQDDYVFVKIQFNHNKALGTPVADVHIHCIPMGSVTGNIRFAVYYKWINYNEVLPIDTAVAAGTWTRTFVTLPEAGTDQYKEGVCTILTNVAAPANETPSSILHVIIIRLGATSSLDTYTSNKTCGGTNSANYGVMYIDAHYQVSKLGSKTSTAD